MISDQPQTSAYSTVNNYLSPIAAVVLFNVAGNDNLVEGQSQYYHLL
jgi:hypothetical protein